MSVFRAAAFGLVAAAAVVLAGSAPARYMAVQTEKVPVARVIANLETAVKENPKDAGAVLNLARAHAMAFAKRADALEVRVKGGGLWFGYEPPFVPFGKATPSKDEAKEADAKVHLTRAAELYDRAVALARLRRVHDACFCGVARGPIAHAKNRASESISYASFA